MQLVQTSAFRSSCEMGGKGGADIVPTVRRRKASCHVYTWGMNSDEDYSTVVGGYLDGTTLTC
jgi:hypothetical protein